MDPLLTGSGCQACRPAALLLFSLYYTRCCVIRPRPHCILRFLPTGLAHIRHGINLSEWFAQVYDPKGYTKEHFESWTTASDIALIKSAGFDHVRPQRESAAMMDAARRHNGSVEYFGYLDAAVKMILDAGLAVEIDMHPDSDFKARLAKEDDFVERFADFWIWWRSTTRHRHGIQTAYFRNSERTGDA